MATRGDAKDRIQGQHDDVELTPGERDAFGQIAAGYTRRSEDQHAGYTKRYQTPSNNVYDQNSGYTRRFGGETRRNEGEHAGYTKRNPNQHGGYTKRDGNQHAGYTKRNGNEHAGFTRRDLKDAEEEGGDRGGGSRKDRLKSLAANGLLNAEKSGDSGAGGSLYTGEGKGGARWGKARSWFEKKNRKKLLVGATVGTGLLPLIALLIFLLAGLKIPHFIENMATWRFVRLTNQYRKSTTNVTGAKAALESLDDAARAEAAKRYGKYRVFDGINRMRPNRVLASLQTAERIQYNYKTTLTGKQKLVSITIAPEDDFRKKVTYKVPSGRFDRLIHPLRTLDQYRTVSDALNSALKTHDPKIPTVVRAAATKAVIKKTGGSLKGLVASRYLARSNTAELSSLVQEMTDLDKQMDALEERQTRLDQQLDELTKDLGEKHQQLTDLHNQWMAVKNKLDAISITDPDWYSKRQPLYAEWDEIRAKQAPLIQEFQAQRLEQINIGKEKTTIFSQLTDLETQRARLASDISSKGGVISDRDAKIALQQEFYEQVKDSGGIAGIVSDEERKLAEDVDKKTDEIVEDKEKLGVSVDAGGGIPDEVLDIAEQGTDPGKMSAAFKKIIGFANPVYDIAMPVCMMYDGSKISHENLDAQQNAVMKEAFLMLATGDQQKNGNNFSTVMAGALNWKTGDIQDSMAMRRISGKPADTTAGLGGQRTTLGTYGQYTVFDALTGGNGGSLNAIADDVCPVATNIWFGIGVGLVNIGIVAFSGGTAAAAEAGATVALKEAISKGLTTLVRKKIAALTLKKAFKVTVQSSGKTFRFGARYAQDVAKWGAITAGSVFMARMIVMDKAGSFNNGLETSAAFLDNVDNGANHITNEVGRANYRSRPLNNVEIAQNWKRERQQIAQYEQQKSTFERYLAIENPNSLLSRMGITAGSLLERSTFSSILNSIAALFNPAGLSSRLFASANSQAVFADSTTNTRDYGNVQWGYSAEEERLMDQDSYASPPENELRLDESGKEQEINDTYSKCFDATPGQLLADGDITRNEEGDVLNEGTCSPLQLGPHNPQYGDLVFRWRLKHNYQNTADLLNGIADPQKASANAGSSLGTIPTGTAQQLATQILSNPNITFQMPQQREAMEYIAQTGKGRDCGAPAVDPKMLGVILALAQKYKVVVGVVVDGHSCNEGFHPRGQAFDLNGITKLDGSAKTSDGNHITWATSEQPLLKEFYTYAGNILSQAGGGGLGQIDCFTGQAPTLNPNVVYFNDSCDHLHVDTGKR